MKMFIILLVILVILSFIPVWPKQVKSGWMRVTTWEKIQLMRGKIFID